MDLRLLPTNEQPYTFVIFPSTSSETESTTSSAQVMFLVISNPFDSIPIEFELDSYFLPYDRHLLVII